mgnify:CR=1 FL=1
MLDKAPILGCDSQSAICLGKNAMFHARTKHIDARYHFIKEVLEDGLITLIEVNTSQNPADDLTKCLTKANQPCIELLCLNEPFWSFKWEVVGDNTPRTLLFLYFDHSM